MKKTLTYCVLTALFLLFSFSGEAAETIIAGMVTDAMDGSPLANVNITFKGTKVGTTSSTDGSFLLHVDMVSEGKLRFSTVGYQSQTFLIKAGEHRGLDVRMVEKVTELNEFKVIPVNEALPILDSVRAHRPAKQVATTQVEEDELSALIPTNLPEHLDIYQPSMEFGSVSFLSPLAKSGTTYYKYRLVDSVETDKGWMYRIDFFPKSSFDPLLRGRMVVDAGTYHLREVRADMPYRANINYLERINYTSTYTQGYLTRDTLQTTWSWRFFRDTTVAKHHIDVAQRTRVEYPEMQKLQIDAPDNSAVNSAGNFGNNGYASTISPVSGISEDSLTSTDSRIFNIARYMAYAMATGYLSTGTWLDFGKVSEFVRYSRYEGLHLGIPFRTNEKLMPHVSLEGYVAYGFRDEGVKWKAQVTALLPTERRNLIGLYAWDRYAESEFSEIGGLFYENKPAVENNRNSFILGIVDAASSTEHQWVTTSYRKRELKTWWERDWCDSRGARPAVETNLSLSLNKTGITSPTYGWRYNESAYMENASIALTTRLSWGEQTRDFFTVRRHRYGKYPTIQLGASFGSVRPEGQSSPGNLYGKLLMQMHQVVGLGMGGSLEYWLQAGMTIGDVPNQMLDPIGVNYSWHFLKPYYFSLLPATYARRFITAFAYWNGGGVLFNRIPGVRYLRLREVAYINVGYADTFHHPYVEGGLGIGNVLGIAEFYLTGRMTKVPVDSPLSDSTPWIGFRVRFHAGT